MIVSEISQDIGLTSGFLSQLYIAISVTNYVTSYLKLCCSRWYVNVFLISVLIFVSSFFYRIILLRNNTLKIVNSSRADEGNYVCRAENQLGSAELTAVLWVKGK